MPRAASQIPEGLVDEFVQLQDEYSKYSELSEREVAIMKKLSEWIRVLQRAVNEAIPLDPTDLNGVFPRVKEAHLGKEGVVEITDKRGMRATVRLEEFPAQVFVSVAKDAVAKLSRIVEERHSLRAKMRELLRVEFVVERVPVYKTEIAYLQVHNRAKSPIQVTLSVLKEGDWATYKRLKLNAGEETNLYLTVLRILESPLPVKFQIKCHDAEGKDYHEVFTLGPIRPHSERLSQLIITQEPT